MREIRPSGSRRGATAAIVLLRPLLYRLGGEIYPGHDVPRRFKHRRDAVSAEDDEIDLPESGTGNEAFN